MRLNNQYRKELLDDVFAIISKEYESSAFGKEFLSVLEQARLLILEARDSMIPLADILVLSKYKAVKTIDSFKLSRCVDSDDDGGENYDYKIETTWHKDKTGDFVFTPGILVPLNYERTVLTAFLARTPKETLAYFFEVSDRYRCEVTAVKNSYKHILEKSTTTQSLVKRAPIFQQFLSEYEEDSVQAFAGSSPIGDSIKTIQSFEQSLIKE